MVFNGTGSSGMGFRFLSIGVLNVDGYCIGGTAAGAAAGDDDGDPMRVVRGGRSLPAQLPDPPILTHTWQDSPRVSWILEAETLPSGALEMGMTTDALNALVTGQKVNVTTSGDGTPFGRGFVYGSSSIQNVPLVLIVNRRTKLTNPENFGADAWETYIYFRVNMRPTGQNITQRELGLYNYFLAMSKATVYPWGEPISVLNDGASDGTYDMFTYQYPHVLDPFLGNNTEDNFILSKTVATVEELDVYLNGVLQTVTTHYTYDAMTNSITFVTEPPTGAWVHVWYGVNEQDMEAA